MEERTRVSVWSDGEESNDIGNRVSGPMADDWAGAPLEKKEKRRKECRLLE
jgi:hypothetical protein